MKKIWKVIIYLTVTLIIAVILAMIFSPYRYHRGESERMIISSVEIDAPIEEAFNYLGNSANAEDWSVFVHHITPINEDEFPDGSVGSIRRAFCEADESGKRWDELTTAVIPNELRRLEVYDFVNFPVDAENLFTEQRYTVLENGNTRVDFTLQYSEEPSLIDAFQTYLAAYRVQSIFDQNLENIKRLVEVNS